MKPSPDSPHHDRSRNPCARVVWRLAIRYATAVAAALLASAGLVAAASVGLRPEAFSVGANRIGWAIIAFLGTVAAGMLPMLAFLSAWLSSRRLGETGQSSLLAQLGLGPLQLWRGLWPLWALLAGIALLLSLGLEAPSWQAVHKLKGSHHAAALGWARLQRGELQALPGGGALVLDQGQLHFASGDGQLQGELGLPSPDQRGNKGGWKLGPASLQLNDGSNWYAEALYLEPTTKALRRYRQAPQSPWATGFMKLASKNCSEEPERNCQKAKLVLHRRLSWPVLTLLMSMLGWLGAWTSIGGGRRNGAQLSKLLLPPLLLYSGLKLGEHALSSGLLNGAAAAWLTVPLLLPLLLTSKTAGGFQLRQSPNRAQR